MKKIFAWGVAAVMLSSASVVSAGNVAAGQSKAAACESCHGAKGNSTDPSFPRLAGQHEDYLLTALTHYKNGKRKNAIMAGQVEKLSKQDLADLAAYFAAQQGLVVKR